jgi:hypothetical protein
MKIFKKVVALSLALLMVIAAVVVSPVSAKAEEKADLTLLNGNFLNNIGEINVFAHPYADQGNWQASMSTTFCWCPTMLLERQENGNWKVVALHAEGTAEWGTDNAVLRDSLLGDGKMMVAWHTGSAVNYTSTTAFLDANCAVGTEFVLTGNYEDMIAVDENGVGKDSFALTGTYLTLAEVEDDTTTDDTTTDEGTTDEPEIKDTGDNFVPMFVVLFAGLAMVTVAAVARKRA